MQDNQDALYAAYRKYIADFPNGGAKFRTFKAGWEAARSAK